MQAAGRFLLLCVSLGKNLQSKVYSNANLNYFIRITAQLYFPKFCCAFICIILLQINEAEEKLRQKVESLNQQEREYENLQEEVSGLKEQLEERGQLLHVASSRVTEVGL